MEIDNNKISYGNQTNIFKPQEPDYYPISESDWDRLKRKINSCKHESNWWQNGGFCSIGISGSAFLSWASLPFNTNDTTVKPILLCVALFTLMIAILCFIAQQNIKRVHSSRINDVKDVFNEIESNINLLKKAE